MDSPALWLRVGDAVRVGDALRVVVLPDRDARVGVSRVGVVRVVVERVGADDRIRSFAMRRASSERAEFTGSRPCDRATRCGCAERGAPEAVDVVLGTDDDVVDRGTAVRVGGALATQLRRGFSLYPTAGRAAKVTGA